MAVTLTPMREEKYRQVIELTIQITWILLTSAFTLKGGMTLDITGFAFPTFHLAIGGITLVKLIRALIGVLIGLTFL